MGVCHAAMSGVASYGHGGSERLVDTQGRPLAFPEKTSHFADEKLNAIPADVLAIDQRSTR
jgi:hypothetical protein